VFESAGKRGGERNGKAEGREERRKGEVRRVRGGKERREGERHVIHKLQVSSLALIEKFSTFSRFASSI
jgi:hypothetical protein